MDRRNSRTVGSFAHRRNALGPRAGFTLLEIVMAMTFLVVGLLAFVEAIVISAASAEGAREQALASQQVRAIIEQMKAQPISQVFRLYNAAPGDDPGGAGTAPGPNFGVAGLNAARDDVDGQVGEILFPITPGNPSVLREDLFDPRFATPRDLDGDGKIDSADHSGNYRLLPVVVRARWLGRAGVTTYTAKTLLVDIP